jgi:hypothetical protein
MIDYHKIFTKPVMFVLALIAAGIFYNLVKAETPYCTGGFNQPRVCIAHLTKPLHGEEN